MTNEVSPPSWSTDDFESLISLVRKHPCLYNVYDPSRKNFLETQNVWEQISQELGKPADECKQRWRTIRDGYMKAMKMGSSGKKTRVVGLFKKLNFLKEIEGIPDDEITEEQEVTEEQEQVIMDNQEYYEITLVDENTDTNQEVKNVTPKIEILHTEHIEEPPRKIGRKNCGRKKYVPLPSTPILTPIKILPKPVVVNGVVTNQVNTQVVNRKVVNNQVVNRPVVNGTIVNGPKNNLIYVEESKVLPTQQVTKRSEVIDSLIEKVLKEHTNEIDVFFRSMAASVKKLQPNLIPKVKMEVCNVIAKYEMQNFENKNSS